MLSGEQSYIIRCLADHIHGRKTDAPGEMDITKLSYYTERHQIEGILYAQSKLPSLRTSFTSDAYYAVTRKSFLQRIHDAFEQNGIRYLIFKGAEISRFYPIPTLRTMADSDILVHPEDKQRAHELFLSLGLENKCLGPNEWIYYTRGREMEYELHHRLMNDELVSLPSHKAFMTRVWDNAESVDDVQYRIDPTYHLAFVLLHLRKHFMNAGVGFRYFMDVAVMATKAEIDWVRLRSYVHELEITDFVITCFSFIHRWFGTETPFGYRELDDAFFEAATKQIFENGVYGFSDAKNRDNYLMVQIRNAKHGSGRVGLFLGKLFPSYDYLCRASRYSFLKGKPWLLPLAWAYRPVASILQGTAKSGLKNAAVPFTVTNDRIIKRKEYLKSWGIDTQSF